ncbi:MAG TPA: universal stress protein [Candidatus Thermoplasmatota archaeon]|jgi:nucleotide-binding universal stress UspA family protein|nr:universal stress protein [Candidatus Thermoplasmatota archaeon]
MRALVPLDGTALGYATLEHGLAMLRAVPKLEVTLLAVMQEGFEATADPAYVAETFEADEEDEVLPSEASSQRVLARGLDIARKQGLAARAKGEIGRPHEEILKEAAHHDVLVVPALPASSLKGRGTASLARQAPCHVLLVRVPASAGKA